MGLREEMACVTVVGHTMGIRAFLWLCGALLVASCSDTSKLPPHGEVVIVVDTDMPVPRIVDRLRIDVYSADGNTWLSSRDVLRPTPSAWPTSFSVYTTQDGAARDAIVRLRAYADRYVADYRGEQFVERPKSLSGPDRLTAMQRPPPPARGDCGSFLCLVDATGANVTPPTVPIAALAIDRLVSVHVDPGVMRAARITLKGNCVGTMADLAGLRTCVDTEATLLPLTREPLTHDISAPHPSQQGSFEASYQLPCNSKPLPETGVHDAEVCIPGGVFVFGSRNEVVQRDRDAYPESMALLPSFFADKYEFSVGRLRGAIDAGYTGSLDIKFNNGPADNPSLPAYPNSCTMSDQPMGREDIALNCVTQKSARELCQFTGGDLPTEVQWEYIATAVGRDIKTLTPAFGPNGFPSCKGVAIARDGDLLSAEAICTPVSGYGTATVTFGQGLLLGDEAFGVVGMSANVSERTRDAFGSLASNCWLSQPLLSPRCAPEATSEMASVRGSSWRQPLEYSSYMIREGVSQTGIAATMGFRCVRSVP